LFFYYIGGYYYLSKVPRSKQSRKDSNVSVYLALYVAFGKYAVAMLLGTYALFSVMSYNWNLNPSIHIRTREVIWTMTRRVVDQTTNYGEQQMLQETSVLLTLGLVKVSDNSIVFCTVYM